MKVRSMRLIPITTPSLFSLNDKWNLWLEELPPLYSPLAEYNFNSQHHHLFTQNILGVTTQNPIFTFSQQGEYRQQFVQLKAVGNGVYMSFKTNNHQLFDELIKKVFNSLSVKEDKRPLDCDMRNLSYENEFYN